MPELHRGEVAHIGSTNIGSSRIARTLAEAAQLDDSTTLSKLRDAVCEYVRVQKAVGTPPETIIARVKSMVNARAANVSYEEGRALLAEVVQGCIVAYYGDERDDRP